MRQPNALVVHTVEPKDCHPSYIAYTDARVAICEYATHLAMTGRQKQGLSLMKFADERLPLLDCPRWDGCTCKSRVQCAPDDTIHYPSCPLHSS